MINIQLGNKGQYKCWEDVNRSLIRLKVFDCQKAIYTASKAGDIKTVRKITQDNKGRNVAAIDKIKSVPPDKCLSLVLSLNILGSSSSFRNIYSSRQV